MNSYPKRVALIVWLIGGIILLTKSGQLLWEAYRLSEMMIWPLSALFIGLILGIIKTRLVFVPFCKRNLKRIEGMKAPQLWNAFSLKFWIMLGLMMTLGATMFRFSHGNVFLLCSVGAIDLMVGAGLLLSVRQFFKKDL